MSSSLAIVLAAGDGRRMKSQRPKVLHEIAGRPMLAHVLVAAREAGVDRIATVIGPDRPDVAAVATAAVPGVAVHVQADRRGTAHAVLAARPAFDAAADVVIVLFGDTPLVRPETIAALADKVRAGAAVCVLGFETRRPNEYGRLILEGGALTAIREFRDASAAERDLPLCNGGLMAIDGRHALALLDAVRPDNLQNEFYLTDVVAIARRQGLAAAYLVAAEDEVLGVNDRAQLAVAEAAMQARLRAAHLSAGVTMIAPETVHLRHDTRIGADVVIEPFVVFGAGVSVEEGATIHAFSHLDGARVGRGAHVGPYARLRPGTVIGEGARIGNFVETKAAEIGAGAKVNHLSYVGDATVGPGANVGAGVITCNYDGFGKFRTEIGEGAFIGSNTALVAPVSVGAGAIVGAGSVITRPVEADALGLARARQEVKPGWARAFRAMRAAAKAKRP